MKTLTKEQRERVLKRLREGVTQRDLALMFNVARTTIERIVKESKK